MLHLLFERNIKEYYATMSLENAAFLRLNFMFILLEFYVQLILDI